MRAVFVANGAFRLVHCSLRFRSEWAKIVVARASTFYVQLPYLVSSVAFAARQSVRVQKQPIPKVGYVRMGPDEVNVILDFLHAYPILHKQFPLCASLICDELQHDG